MTKLAARRIANVSTVQTYSRYSCAHGTDGNRWNAFFNFPHRQWVQSAKTADDGEEKKNVLILYAFPRSPKGIFH